MKNKDLLMFIALLLAFLSANTQELPPRHRGMHPVLKADGTVVDESGKQLGSIKNGTVCDVTGKVIGIVSAHGDVTAANGKSIGKIQKDGSFRSMKGHVVTTDPDGVVKVAGKEVARVEAGYKDQSHGCALHCFFSSENQEAENVDQLLSH